MKSTANKIHPSHIFIDEATPYAQYNDTFPVEQAARIKKSVAKKELMDSEFHFGWGVQIPEEKTKEWIDEAFNYLFKRYKKGKKKGTYSISSGNTLVSGKLFTDADGNSPQIEITVSKNYTQYNCYL